MHYLFKKHPPCVSTQPAYSILIMGRGRNGVVKSAKKKESILSRNGNQHAYFIGRASSSMVQPNLKEVFIGSDILRIAEKLTPQQLAAAILN